MIRVRFAPSPTGYLHIGAVRTALYNWLFARHHQGCFVLRIEDTDETRSSEAMTEEILHSLAWLGLNWDEGPVYQSKRIALYREKTEELIRKGEAYPCYCLPEELQKRKKEVEKSGKYWDYDRRCLHLTKSEKEAFDKEGRPRAVRFKVSPGEIVYKDEIHGSISVHTENIEDFVLQRSDGLPTYHLSVVVDDIDLGITHVIRGDDHISNTPKQILLYRAFGVEPPVFAHMSLIVGPDKKKLSKRHGVTSVLEYKKQGYLPLALLNFLAQMGWCPGEEERIYSMEEMVHNFSVAQLSKGNPVFDVAKLEWFNGQLISQLPSKELSVLIKDELKKAGLWEEQYSHEKEEWFLKIIDLLKERSRRINDFPDRIRPFLSDDYPFEKEGVEKYLKDKRLMELLSGLKKDFEKMPEFTAEVIEKALRARAEKEGVKAALFIHALRMLVLGMKVSPGIFNVLELLGREKTIERMGKLTLFIE